MGKKPSKAYQGTAAFVAMCAAMILLCGFFIYFAMNRERQPRFAPDPVNTAKQDILRVVQSDSPITAAEREMLFSSLSGTKMLEYHFSELEKLLIVRALNAASLSSKIFKKGPASARESLLSER